MSHLCTAPTRRALIGTLLLGAFALTSCSGGTSTYGGAPSTTQAPTTGASPAGAGTTAAPAGGPVHEADSKYGRILVDTSGRTVYGFTRDTDGKPTCSGGCLNAWPPVTLDSATLPAGMDATVFSIVDGTEGTHQLRAGKFPLYLYAGDDQPGETNGQGSGGVWFVVNGKGELVKAPAAAATTTAAMGGY